MRLRQLPSNGEGDTSTSSHCSPQSGGESIEIDDAHVFSEFIVSDGLNPVKEVRVCLPEEYESTSRQEKHFGDVMLGFQSYLAGLEICSEGHHGGRPQT